MAGTQNYLASNSPMSKDTWLPGCFEQLEDTPGLLFNMVDQMDPDRIDGRNAFFKTGIGRSLGQGMVQAQGGDFPLPESRRFDEGKVTVARLAHSIEITMDEFEMLRREAAAAVDVVADGMQAAVSMMTRTLVRQTHGDGTGILARCAASGPSLTVALQTTSTNQYDRDRSNWLEANGAIIDIVDATTGAAIANGTGRIVEDVDDPFAPTTITLDSAGGNVTTTTSHVIVWRGSVDDFSSGTYVSGEIVGIGQLLKDDRTWNGINSATAGKGYWDPVIVEGTSPGTPESFTLGRIQKLLVRMSKRASDGMQPGPESGHVLFSGPGVAAHAIAQYADSIRYVNPKPGERLTFGFTEIEGLGLTWLQDIHYAHNVLDCLRVRGENGIKFVRPMNPMNGLLDFITTGSGDMWHLANASASGHQGHAAKMFAYLTGNFGVTCKRPADNGRLNDVTEVS
jgi:hypothetical protein